LWSVIKTPMHDCEMAGRDLDVADAIGTMPGKGFVEQHVVGRVASARAISTRRRSPPDSAIDGVCAAARC